MTPQERAQRVQRLAPAMLMTALRRDDTMANDGQVILEEMLGRRMEATSTRR